jgi:GntR family transcriptional regulator/MocR family aminotransferase
VIHLGTFSKSLAPSLRLGYLVLPPALATDMLEMLKPLYIAGSRFTHAVMARFLSAGHLDRHVERMRRAYARKMHALCAALNEAFGTRVAISGHTTGLHLVARFPGRKMTEDLREACVRGGVRFETVADYTLDQAESDAILLGFGNLSVDEIREGVRRLKVVMRRPR